MRSRLLVAATLICFSATAQTYFYIDAISVQPATPNTSDMISIDLEGGLSSTGSYIVSATAEVNGNTVTISIEAATDIGLDVIVPHVEPVAVGQLSAGAYEIVIDGNFVGDFTPDPDHFFTVTGGSPCDDLDLDFVHWAAFSDTALTIHVFNNSTELFDYPGFILLDVNGDTLAMEVVNFFGIGLESSHTLTIHPDAQIPSGPFSGELQLWTGFYDEQACSWELDVDLCPPAPCDSLLVGLQNFGNALTLGDFDWTMLDDELETVGAGQLILTEEVQYDWDTLCLPPGHYRLMLTPLQPSTGGQPYFGLDRLGGFGGFGGPSIPLISEQTSELEFDFYPACFDATNAVQETVQKPSLFVRRLSDGLELIDPNGSALGTIEVFDANGRLVHSQSGTSSTLRIDLRQLPSGLLIIRAADEVMRFPWVAE